MTFGEKLMSARLAHNLSQTELAELIGVTERTIYSYEQAGAFPRTAVLKKIAEALKLSVAYLMDEKETDNRVTDYDELFIQNAKNTYGSKGAREAREVLDKASALFAGGELDDSAKEIFFQSLMEVYLESKAEAREKYSPKRRKNRVNRAGGDADGVN